MVSEWVDINPFPTVLLREDRSLIHQNAAYAELQDQLHLDGLEVGFKRSEEDGTPLYIFPFPDDLKDGECIVKPVQVAGNVHYMLHVTKLALSSYPCICCMLLPGTDPSEDNLSGILDSVESLIAQIDVRGNVSYSNTRLQSLLGYKDQKEEVILHLRQIEKDFSGDLLQQRVEEARSQGLCRYRCNLTHRDGRIIPVDVSLVLSGKPGNSSLLLTARDITAQLTHEGNLNSALAEVHKDFNAADQENVRLRAKLDGSSSAAEMVYKSAAMERIYRRIEQVAPTDVTVLVTGESGTGKELVAKSIHRLSKRSEEAFITVDCASLPAELIESELFGYRKGAFTGAYRDRMGRFEAADRGTIFLDEIGELPIMLQSRLLRVIQDGTFVPVGETQELTVDVRVIAATNRDLKQLIEDGQFRSDLYYRLHVFPIETVPLRKRPEDIDVLIDYFIKKFNRRFDKHISGLDESTLMRIRAYHFPGNVRELENMVERAFIISNGGVLPIEVPEKLDGNSMRPVLDVVDGRLSEFLPLEEYQRKYIQMVLESTNGKVSGANGAAEILKVNPQTLFSKMKRLGIRR